MALSFHVKSLTPVLKGSFGIREPQQGRCRSNVPDASEPRNRHASVGPIRGPTLLYLQVSDLNAVIAAIDPATIVVPRRKTFYGADEFFVRAEGGHIVGFAAFDEPKTEGTTV